MVGAEKASITAVWPTCGNMRRKDTQDRQKDRQVAGLLTFQVLFLWSGLLMCSGFTHSSAHLRPSQCVLRRGDAVRQRLTRHLLSSQSSVQWSYPPTPKRSLGNPSCPQKITHR